MAKTLRTSSSGAAYALTELSILKRVLALPGDADEIKAEIRCAILRLHKSLGHNIGKK